MTGIFRILLVALCLGLTGLGAIATAEPAYAVGSRWDPNGAP